MPTVEITSFKLLCLIFYSNYHYVLAQSFLDANHNSKHIFTISFFPFQNYLTTFLSKCLKPLEGNNDLKVYVKE